VEITIALELITKQWEIYRANLSTKAHTYFKENKHQHEDFKERYFQRVSFALLWNDIWKKFVGVRGTALRSLQDIQHWLTRLLEPTQQQARKEKQILRQLGGQPLPFSEKDIDEYFRQLSDLSHTQLSHQSSGYQSVQQELTIAAERVRSLDDSLHVLDSEIDHTSDRSESWLTEDPDQEYSAYQSKLLTYGNKATEAIRRLVAGCEDQQHMHDVLNEMLKKTEKRRAEATQVLTGELDKPQLAAKFEEFLHANVQHIKAGIIASLNEKRQDAELDKIISPTFLQQLTDNLDSKRKGFREAEDHLLSNVCYLIDSHEFMCFLLEVCLHQYVNKEDVSRFLQEFDQRRGYEHRIIERLKQTKERGDSLAVFKGLHTWILWKYKQKQNLYTRDVTQSNTKASAIEQTLHDAIERCRVLRKEVAQQLESATADLSNVQVLHLKKDRWSDPQRQLTAPELSALRIPLPADLVHDLCERVRRRLPDVLADIAHFEQMPVGPLRALDPTQSLWRQLSQDGTHTSPGQIHLALVIRTALYLMHVVYIRSVWALEP
jgi:hypothetical protein